MHELTLFQVLVTHFDFLTVEVVRESCTAHLTGFRNRKFQPRAFT